MTSCEFWKQIRSMLEKEPSVGFPSCDGDNRSWLFTCLPCYLMNWVLGHEFLHQTRHLGEGSWAYHSLPCLLIFLARLSPVWLAFLNTLLYTQMGWTSQQEMWLPLSGPLWTLAFEYLTTVRKTTSYWYKWTFKQVDIFLNRCQGLVSPDCSLIHILQVFQDPVSYNLHIGVFTGSILNVAQGDLTTKLPCTNSPVLRNAHFPKGVNVWHAIKSKAEFECSEQTSASSRNTKHTILGVALKAQLLKWEVLP